MNAITVTDLQLRRGPDFVLGPVSFAMAAGSRVALVGPSGCGKTTLLRCLAGLEAPDQGRIQIGERMVTDTRVLVPPGDRRIGFVFQDAALWPHLSAVRHLRFAAPTITTEQALAVLEQVGLLHARDQRPGQLSGGEAQRLQLARALVGEPNLLLLDEPLHSVDVHLRDELSMLIRRIAEERGLTMVLVTHDRDEALAIADDLIVMHAGGIVEQGPAQQLLTEPRTAFCAAFLGRGVRLPVVPGANGSVETAFGSFPKPEAHRPEDLSLMLLPGDVVFGEGDDGPRGRIVKVLPTAAGNVAWVEVCGVTVQVPCDAGTRVDDRRALELTGAPRLLPRGDAT